MDRPGSLATPLAGNSNSAANLCSPLRITAGCGRGRDSRPNGQLRLLHLPLLYTPLAIPIEKGRR